MTPKSSSVADNSYYLVSVDAPLRSSSLRGHSEDSQNTVRAPIPFAGREYSLVLMKPDAVEADIALHVLHRIASEVRGQIRATRIFHLTPAILREHYAHVVDLGCYPRIERFMLRSDVLAAIIEGAAGTILNIRKVLGATDPREAAPGTIRHRYGRVEGEENYNVAHASDSQQSAFAEIRRFFTQEQIRMEVPEIADRVFGKEDERCPPFS